jgi:membrane-bound lytic murein transglycosylase D
MKQSLLKGWAVCGIFLLLGAQVYSSDKVLSFEKKWTNETSEFVRQALNGMTIPFASNYDSKVEKLVKNYMTRGSRSFEKMLGKSEYYFPIFEQALKEKGLPAELKYLPLVESNLYPKVESSAGAGGLWQFMPPTARHYELKMDEWIDERQDPYLSSIAAATMLKQLYQQFEDWQLVLAAYNCGPGRVRKAIRKAGSSDYDLLKSYLPLQTREYLKKYTATALVMENHQILGLKPQAFDLDYAQTSVLRIYEWMSFKGISEFTGVPIKELERLNPSYKKGIIPKSEWGNLLVIPKTVALSFEQFLSNKGIESLTYLRGEPEHVEPVPSTEYWASAHVRSLPSKMVFQFNVQGLLSWSSNWGKSLFGTLRLGSLLGLKSIFQFTSA